ncbi:MAG: hypothetical protein JNM36_09615 [Chitinophagales bacterium]|jgi:hypothetical protein|nr:hypothetical protein [Chitinophagales bacterium]HNI44138.1 hypothetical protein [Chitinophagales bacterium]HNL08088.1 hypothetical protein [Chitinophagales bacterium]
MNGWKHCLLSKRKFGGEAIDYVEVHKFIDSSKYFCYHVKHRVLLHNLFGVELCTEIFGDFLTNSDGKIIPVRDIAVEHCKEDLSNNVPTLWDWFKDNDDVLSSKIELPKIEDADINTFVNKPFLRSGLKSTMIITCSDFGVYLIEKKFGIQKAIEFCNSFQSLPPIKSYLEMFRLTKKWQYTPNKNEINWLNEINKNEPETTIASNPK